MDDGRDVDIVEIEDVGAGRATRGHAVGVPLGWLVPSPT